MGVPIKRVAAKQRHLPLYPAVEQRPEWGEVIDAESITPEPGPAGTAVRVVWGIG